MSEWKPIDTAPRDGTLVLLRDEREGHWPKVGYWYERRWTKWARWTTEDGRAIHATHWTFLPPDPPEAP